MIPILFCLFIFKNWNLSILGETEELQDDMNYLEDLNDLREEEAGMEEANKRLQDVLLRKKLHDFKVRTHSVIEAKLKREELSAREDCKRCK